MATPERVDLSAHLGPEIPDHIKEQIAEAVTRAIRHPDADVDAILQRAKTIAERAAAGEIQNVLHYATKVLFAVSKEQRGKETKEPVVFPGSEYFEEVPHPQTIDSAVEKRILLEQIFANLSESEREVYKRRLEGWTHEEIGEQLGMTPESSRSYWSRARQAVMKRLGRKERKGS